jgi:hypothetical protein
MPTRAFTIRKLADAAGVGVEAMRYYQGRGLLHEPPLAADPAQEVPASEPPGRHQTVHGAKRHRQPDAKAC